MAKKKQIEPVIEEPKINIIECKNRLKQYTEKAKFYSTYLEFQKFMLSEVDIHSDPRFNKNIIEFNIKHAETMFNEAVDGIVKMKTKLNMI